VTGRIIAKMAEATVGSSMMPLFTCMCVVLVMTRTGFAVVGLGPCLALA
jgi:hypothetical protein